MRPQSSSANQRKLQGSAKRVASRESSQNFVRKNGESQSQMQQISNTSTGNKRTPRVDARSSYAKGDSSTGIRNFEEYKDGNNQRNYMLDQAQERSIIEEVKSQK